MTYKLALVCFSLVFPKHLSPHKGYFFPGHCILYTLDTVGCWFGGSMGCPAPCSVVTSGLWGTVVRLCNQTCASALFLSLLYFFYDMWEWESFNVPHVPWQSDNHCPYPFFASFAVPSLSWCPSGVQYIAMGPDFTCRRYGMNKCAAAQEHCKHPVVSFSCIASSPAALAEARVCLFGLLSQQLLLGVDPQRGCRWRWWLLFTALWH